MGLYQRVRELYKQPKTNLGKVWQERLIKLRKQKSIVKIEKPTRIDRARSLGYKAKKGFIIARVKLKRGGRKRGKPSGGRRSKKSGRTKIVAKNYRRIAEERAQKKYKNLNVLGSYELAKDGKFYWFEIILVDPHSPEIIADSRINWICNKKQKGRVFRGLTSAGRKSRGLRKKGFGAEKIRPSRKARMKK